MFSKLSVITVLCSPAVMYSAAAQDVSAQAQDQAAQVTQVNDLQAGDKQAPDMRALDVIERSIEATGGRGWFADG